MRVTRRTVLVLIAAALAAGVIPVSLQYQEDLRTAVARSSSGSQIVETPCGPIEYAVAGTGPPVLMVHGAGGGFDQAVAFGEPLVRAGYTVIAPSRFGYLRTPLPPDASPPKQAEAHRCLLDALRLQRVAAIGGSAGAPSVMQLCLRYPDRCSSMVLLVPMAFVPPAAGPPVGAPSPLVANVIDTTLSSDAAFWIASRLARDTLIETILATPIEDFHAASQAEQDRVLRALSDIQPISRRAGGLRNDAAIGRELPRYPLERIATRTLLATTENDRYGTFASSRHTARHIPGARLVTWPDGGHLWVGRQEQVWSAVLGFLSEAAPATRRTPADPAAPLPARVVTEARQQPPGPARGESTRSSRLQ